VVSVYKRPVANGVLYFFQRRLSLCLSVFMHDISETAEAKIIELDIEMFLCESWKFIYVGAKRSKFKVARHKK